MAESTMPQECYDEIKGNLPPEKTIGPLGGRPLVSQYIAMKVIHYFRFIAEFRGCVLLAGD